MDVTFDKHGWLRAVQKDRAFTDREFRLAFVICNEFTWRNGKGWAVELDHLADAIKGGFSDVKLRAALAKMCKAGYLVETYRRSTGPGITAKRSHDLRLPQNTATAQLHRSDNTATEQFDTATVRFNTATVRFDTATERFDQNPPDQGKDTPKGTSEGTTKGTSEGAPSTEWCHHCAKDTAEMIYDAHSRPFCSQACLDSEKDECPF